LDGSRGVDECSICSPQQYYEHVSATAQCFLRPSDYRFYFYREMLIWGPSLYRTEMIAGMHPAMNT